MRSLIARFERLGLQRRIMLYVSAGLVVFSAVFGLVALQAIQQSTDLVFSERLLVARTIAHAVDDDLTHIERELEETSNSVSPAFAASRSSEAQNILHSLYNHWTLFHGFQDPCVILLTDPRGRVVMSEPAEPALIGRDLAQDANLQNVFQASRVVATNDIAPSGPALPTVAVAVPIQVRAQTIGFLVGEINRDHISAELAPWLRLGELGYGVELIDGSGRVIASNGQEHSVHTSAHWALVSPYLRARQTAVQMHPLQVNGEDLSHVIAFAPLEQMEWGVIVEQQADAALALPRNLETEFIVFGVLALAGGLALAWVTTRTVVRPVRALIHASQEIARGDLGHPLDVSGGDEVGVLARAFDEMRVELRQSRDEIARWNRELEARVQERTRELTALVESSHALTATLDLDVLFEILIKETRTVVPSAEGIVFFLFDDAPALLTVRSTFGFDAAACEYLGFRIGEGIAGKVFEALAPARLRLAAEVRAAQSNLSAENLEHFLRAIGERQVLSALGTPLVSKGARLGALVLYNFSREDAFTENDVTVLQAFADQAAAAIENARLYASLREKEAARAALLNQVIQAQEEERLRVAREIHDELGQLLTRLSINLKMCETQIAAAPPQAARTLAATQTLVWQTIEQAHRLIVELRPTLLDELGLEAALREELTTRLAPLGVTTTLDAAGAPKRLPAPVEIAVFRIAQEAISNIARHAHATRAMLSLRADRGGLDVLIEDDGVGIPDDWRNGANGHRPLGLLGMQERAALLGGRLTIEPRGTRVLLRVPPNGNVAPEEKVK